MNYLFRDPTQFLQDAIFKPNINKQKKIPVISVKEEITGNFSF